MTYDLRLVWFKKHLKTKGMKHNFKKLIIWQESIELVIEIHKITKTFPSEEKFGSQVN